MGQENLPWNLVEGKTRADDPRFWPGGAQLSGETFENALIVDVDITAAELIGATFRNCTLARLDLRDGFMSEAVFEDCIFYKCDLRRADLSNATLTNVIIDRSNLCSAKFTGVKTSNFKLTRSEASPCDFRKSVLNGFFSYCDLSAVNFDAADIDNLELYRCNIKFSRVNAAKHECTTTGIEAAERAGDHQVPWFLTSQTRLEEVPNGDLENAYFFGKDLSMMDFSGRTLKNVNFLRCNMVETNFSNTTFDNVWFWDCEVDQLVMNDAKALRLNMSFAIGTIEAKNTDFRIWNVSDSELEGSNFEGSTLHAATFSMSQFPNSNFSNCKEFIVESFMTDFIHCNFEGTDVSPQAAERSYFDEGVEFLPIAASALRKLKDTGDILELYLPPEDLIPRDSGTGTVSSDTTKETAKTEEKHEATPQPAAAQTVAKQPASPESKKSAEKPKAAAAPFLPVEEDAFVDPSQAKKDAKPAARSLTLEPLHEEEPAKKKDARAKKTSAPSPAVSQTTPKPADTRSSGASPKAAAKPVAPPLDIVPSPVETKPTPEAKPAGSVRDTQKPDKLALNSEKTRPAGPNLAEALKAHEHATGKKPETDTKRATQTASQKSGKISTQRSGGHATLAPGGSPTGPSPATQKSSPKPAFGGPKKSPFGGSAAKPSLNLQPPSSLSSANTSSTSPSPSTSSAPSPSPSPLGPPTSKTGPTTSPYSSQSPKLGSVGGPASSPDKQPEVKEASAPSIDLNIADDLKATQPQNADVDRKGLSGIGGVNTAPPGSRANVNKPDVAQQTPVETAPQPTTPEPSTDLVHHSDAPPKLGFFARIINWFKSLFS